MVIRSDRKRVLYANQDPREAGAYTIAEASRLTGVNKSTLSAWTWGQRAGGRRRFRPVLRAPVDDSRFLSFFHLAELHVLAALRLGHGVPLQRIRKTIEYITEMAESGHPLLDLPLRTNGVDVFVEYLGDLINCSQKGQIEMKQVLLAHLERLDRDDIGVQRLYPFTRAQSLDGEMARHPRLVVIDPRIAFGQPVIVGTRIRTSVVAERFRAGESAASLAKDYGRRLSEIEEAIRCETKAA